MQGGCGSQPRHGLWVGPDQHPKSNKGDLLQMRNREGAGEDQASVSVFFFHSPKWRKKTTQIFLFSFIN